MGLLKQTHKDEIGRKLSQKAPNCRCPACRSNNFGIADELVGFPIIEKGVPTGIGPGDQLWVAFILQCMNCHHDMFFPVQGYLDVEDL